MIETKENTTVSIQTLLLFFVCFILCWILAWLLFLQLKSQPVFTEIPNYHFVYWSFIRLLVWFLPSIFFVRYLKPISEISVFETKNLSKSLVYGFAVGCLLIGLNLTTKYFGNGMSLNLTFSSDWFNAVLISPFVEELLFRGVILNASLTRMKFLKANLLTSALFTLIHFPGWYFQGKLGVMLVSPIGGAFSIFFLGFIFGLIAGKTKHIGGGVLAHLLNNFSNI